MPSQPLGMGSLFYPTHEELYSLQMEIRQIHMVQSNHAERISRIEKRNANDATIKSVWNSPFASALGGTPQHGRYPFYPTSSPFVCRSRR